MKKEPGLCVSLLCRSFVGTSKDGNRMPGPGILSRHL